MRVIMFDTETTGRSPETGDRIVEIGCVEMIGFDQGRTFHRYVNPQCDVPEEVVKVHGLTGAFLADKPLFSDPDVVDALLAFFGEDPIVAHNASFDRRFLNAELARMGRSEVPEARFIDTYAMAAAKLKAGAKRSLDALARHFQLDRLGFDLSGRKNAGGHGALLDARMLAEIYIGLQGGREQTLGFITEAAAAVEDAAVSAALSAWPRRAARPHPLPTRLTEAEAQAHDAFVNALGPAPLWRRGEA